MKDGYASEYPLNDNGTQRTKSKIFHPAAAIDKPRPDGDHDAAHAGKPSNHAVAVLVHDAANPGRKFYKMAV